MKKHIVGPVWALHTEREEFTICNDASSHDTGRENHSYALVKLNPL